MRFVAKDIPLEQRRQWRILNPDGTPVDGEGHVVWADDETGEYEVCLLNEHGEHYLVGNVWDIQRPDGTLIDPRRWATEVRRGPIRVVPPMVEPGSPTLLCPTCGHWARVGANMLERHHPMCPEGGRS